MSKLTPLSPQLLAPVLAAHPQARRWWLAYSGGVDSRVLLALCDTFLSNTAVNSGARRPILSAIHIDHGLHPDSPSWASHCIEQARQINCPIVVKQASLSGADGNIEARARAARYELIESELEPDDVVLFAQHQEDQAETFLLRLLRGSGSHGLSAMPESRPLGEGYLFRPLLSMAKSQILSFAEQHGLSWVEDPSNQRDYFNRNYLRLRVAPLLAMRWPRYARSVASAASLQAESARLNDDLAVIDMHALGSVADLSTLSVEGLKVLPSYRQKNLLRYWLKQRGVSAPTQAQLRSLLDGVVGAIEDAAPVMDINGYSVYRFRGQLQIEPTPCEFDVHQQIAWDGLQSIKLPCGTTVSLKPTKGAGIDARCLAEINNGLTIRYRQGGERCRPAGRKGSRSLKKLLQDYSVPYWLRDRLPLLYAGDSLVAVANLWVEEGWQAVGDGEGLEFLCFKLCNESK